MLKSNAANNASRASDMAINKAYLVISNVAHRGPARGERSRAQQERFPVRAVRGRPAAEETQASDG